MSNKSQTSPRRSGILDIITSALGFQYNENSNVEIEVNDNKENENSVNTEKNQENDQIEEINMTEEKNLYENMEIDAENEGQNEVMESDSVYSQSAKSFANIDNDETNIHTFGEPGKNCLIYFYEFFFINKFLSILRNYENLYLQRIHR
jgi:hypothetical protein